MHFTTPIIITASLNLALGTALPTSADTNAKRQATVLCNGLYGTPQCCATDVLGVADLDCANPPTTPTSVDDFVSTCGAIGQRARCCVLPILGQDLLCDAPQG